MEGVDRRPAPAPTAADQADFQFAASLGVNRAGELLAHQGRPNGGLLGLDRERGELLCFIGAEVDAGTFQAFLVPLFCQLMNEVTGDDWNECREEWNEGSIDA